MDQSPITVRAAWDPEAGVSVIACDEVAGLNLEAGTYDEIERKVTLAMSDLAECDPGVAALAGWPLDICTLRYVARLAFAP